MIKINLICGMAVARRSPDDVGRELARVIAERRHRHDDPEDEEEAAAANELTSETVTEKHARILEGCNAYAFVKQDLSLVVREDQPPDVIIPCLPYRMVGRV